MGPLRPNEAPLRFALLGTRGIPAQYGGFETFAERIAPLLVERHGIQVTVIGDSSMELADGRFGEVRLARSRFDKSHNPLRFYWELLGMARDCADVAVVCGTPGGGLGFRAGRKLALATNPDGLESRRGKWATWVQWLFVASEKAATWFSDALVCDSAGIEDYYRKRHGAKRTYVAEYGAPANPFLAERSGELAGALKREGLRAGEYHLVVARMEPENNLHLMLKAYQEAFATIKHPLYILSNRPKTAYAEQLTSAPPAGVVFHGAIFDTERVQALRAGALSYVHGHSVGGTNPSLVEAMAAGNLCLCHDNEFNRATTAGAALFFRDSAGLGAHLCRAEEQTASTRALGQSVLQRWAENFTWEQIADKYALLLRDMHSRGGQR